MVVTAMLFRSKIGTSLVYGVSAAGLLGLVLYAQPLLDSLDKLQSYLPIDSDWQEQAFRLGTVSDRLMGYQNILTNPGTWPLFANPLKFRPADLGYEDVEYSHDILSQMILRVGAVPVFVGICAGIFVLWQAHRAILRLPLQKNGIRILAARIMAVVMVFLLSQVAGAGLTVFPMNFWFGIFTGLLSVICIRMVNPAVTGVKGSGKETAIPALVGRR